jgi:sugar phosphate isomerase/epimerase
MILARDPAVHLTYCLNIHPGESWAENAAAIRTHATAVRDRVLAGRGGARVSFGLGLRLSRTAATELLAAGRLDELRALLESEGLYAFTINGFPFGAFHGTRVKEDVYRPDWRTTERRDYTNDLIDILAALLPSGVGGSISTVPGSYKAWIASERDVAAMARNLAECAAHAADVRRRTGRLIRIGLEPEPDCFLETTDEAVRFFTGPMLREGAPHLAGTAGLGAPAACDAIRTHLGVCFDTCHLALQFEDLTRSLDRLRAAGVGVSKIQISAALTADAAARAAGALAGFVDPMYLHQVKSLGADGIRSCRDLDQALAGGTGCDGAGEWRIHFHVPLYFTGRGGLGTTAAALTPAFFAALRAGACEHLEIETYTFSVLPPDMRAIGLTESIAREYGWTLDRLGPGAPGAGDAATGRRPA